MHEVYHWSCDHTLILTSPIAASSTAQHSTWPSSLAKSSGVLLFCNKIVMQCCEIAILERKLKDKILIAVILIAFKGISVSKFYFLHITASTDNMPRCTAGCVTLLFCSSLHPSAINISTMSVFPFHAAICNADRSCCIGMCMGRYSITCDQ